jgi:hypothetical protein
MAISVTLDLFKDSTFEISSAALAQPSRFVRIAMVEGIDVTVVSGSPKYEAMFLAQQAVVAACAASPLTNHPELILQRILLEAISDTSAIARIIYETVVFGVGIPPSTYVLTDGAMLTTKQTRFIVDANGKRVPIMTSWAPTTNTTGTPPVSLDFVPMSLLFPVRTLQVDALTYGRQTNGQAFLRHVNDNTWPTVEPSFPGNPPSGPTPLPRGFFLLASFVTRQFSTGGYYTLSASAISNVIHDWSEPGVLQDTRTGKYVQPGIDVTESNAMVEALFSSQYEFGVIEQIDTTNPNAPNRPTGLIRVGPFPTADFSGIFGF